jgi:hypothetical protein
VLIFGIGFGVLASLIVDIQPVAAQSILAPSEPIKLFPPKGTPEANPHRLIPPPRWSQIPAEGIVLDPGAHEALDAADPASPFQSSGSGKSPVAGRFGSKIPVGLPDREISEGMPLRSELVSDPGMALSEQETLEGMWDPDDGQEGDEQAGAEGGLRSSQKKANRQREMQQRRLVGSFPRDFLLDATDPGLFQFLNDQWIPSRAADGKEAVSGFEVTAHAAWEELRPRLMTRLQACDALLRKGSVYSARDEIRMGLLSLARKLDQLAGPSSAAGQRKSAIRKSMPHESALQHALRELDECSYANSADLPAAVDVKNAALPPTGRRKLASAASRSHLLTPASTAAATAATIRSVANAHAELPLALPGSPAYEALMAKSKAAAAASKAARAAAKAKELAKATKSKAAAKPAKAKAADKPSKPAKATQAVKATKAPAKARKATAKG